MELLLRPKGQRIVVLEGPMTKTDQVLDPTPLRAALRGDPDMGGAADLFGNAKVGSEITLRRLRIFWAVAHSATMTQAAKLLNVSQPTLSQQLTGFEAAIGTNLFERRSNGMILTEAGELFLRKAEPVLRSAQEMEDFLPSISSQPSQMVRIAGVASVMRVIVPAAMRQITASAPAVEFDIHENAPAEIIDLLYARRVNIGLMAANSVSEVSAGFQQLPVAADPFVLAVPAHLDLSGVRDPARDLDGAAQRLLNSTIQFVFGTQHSSRIQDWFDQVLPQSRLTSRVRSFELALDLVSAGLGVCVVPALTVMVGDQVRKGVRLYAINLEPRRIVAMVPSQYLRVPPYGAFLSALQSVGQAVVLPSIETMPPFIAAAAIGMAQIDMSDAAAQ